MGARPNDPAAAAANAQAFKKALALAQATSKLVVCSAGETYYLPTQTLIGAPGVTVDGRGATLKQLAGTQKGNWLIVTACRGFALRNLTVDGNRANAVALGRDSSLLLVHDTADVDIGPITVHGSSGKGLSITSGVAGGGTRRIRVHDTTAFDCAAQCVMTDRSNGGAENPACEDITLDHITVRDTGHAGVAINDGSRRVTLTNSVIDPNNATWDAVSVRGSRDVTIRNTIGRRGRNGCGISVLDAAALARGEDARNITLVDNVWEHNKQNGTLIAGAINVSVTGDINRNNGQAAVAAGINVTQVAGVRRSAQIRIDRATAIDNQARPTQAVGISVAAADDVRIVAPTIFGNATNNRVKLVTGATAVEILEEVRSGPANR